jgi:hypothetical protein
MLKSYSYHISESTNRHDTEVQKNSENDYAYISRDGRKSQLQ